MKTKNDLYNEIKEYLLNNEEFFNEAIEELDNWTGRLDYERWLDMEELEYCLEGKDTIDILNRVYYGSDLDAWHKDINGDIIFNSFNPNRYYFRFNAYMNLESSDTKEYTHLLDSGLIDEFVENYRNLDIKDNYTFIEMLEKLEESA